MQTTNFSRSLIAILVIATLNLLTTGAARAAAAQSTVLYSFSAAPDGNYPAADLIFDHSGNLYGTTVQGGAFGSGAVFKLSPSNGQWAETIIYSFCRQIGCTDGTTPYGSLVLDPAGNLYGTTFQGGVYGGGIVFRLTPHTNGEWIETVVHSFGKGTDGVGPLAGVVFNKAGNLYGTTYSGGTSGTSCFAGCGTVFELARDKNGRWKEKVLYSFCSQPQCADGNSIDAGVILDDAGNLYGTAGSGGDTFLEGGTVFELTPGPSGQWTEKTLHVFVGGADGEDPHAALVLDKAGSLYGTTAFGGLNGNNGTVFKLTPGTNGQWTETVLYSFCLQFNCSDGSSTYAGLVFDKGGNLYGTNFGGGASNWGTVFELSPGKNGNWTDTVLHSFEGGTDGINPHAGLIFDRNGNLYGVTYQQGTGGYGTVFELTP